MKTKKIALILIFSVIFNTCVFATTSFKDLSDTHWANSYIANLYEAGIVAGYPDGTFRPNENIRINEFIAMTLRANGYHFESKSSDWSKPYIEKAIELKIIEDREFLSYTAQITREQMLSIAVNAVALQEARGGNDVDLYVRNDIKDYHLIDDYYKQNIIDGYKFGLVSGYPDGTFKPKGLATRAEASIILSRMMKPAMRNPYHKSDAKSVLVPRWVWYDSMGNIVPVELVDLDKHTYEIVDTPLYAPIWNGEPVIEIVEFAEVLLQVSGKEKGFLTFGGNPLANAYGVGGYKSKEFYDSIFEIPNELERSFVYAERLDFSLSVDYNDLTSKYRPYGMVQWKTYHHATGYDSYEAFWLDTYGEQLRTIFDFWFEEESDYSIRAKSPRFQSWDESPFFLK